MQVNAYNISLVTHKNRMTSTRKNSKLLLIERIALWLSKTQGRDKLCKLLQYIFRYLASHFILNSYQHNKFNYLFEETKDARKIFRLFKSINQLEEMANLLFNSEQSFANIMQFFSRVCFSFYWLFDNISILSKVRLFNFDFKKYYQIANSFWFFSLFFMNFSLIYQLYFEKKEDIKSQQMSQKQQISKIPQDCPLIPEFQIIKMTSIKQIDVQQQRKIRKNKILNLIKYTFDIIPSGKDSKILQIIFNRVIPQKFASVCGFMSAAISCYQSFE